MSKSCSPTVGVSAEYPHHLELTCWEHGVIADLDFTPTAATIARHVDQHKIASDWAHPGRQQYCGPGCTDIDHPENRRSPSGPS